MDSRPKGQEKLAINNKNSIGGNSVYSNTGVNGIQYTVCGKQISGS